MRSCCFKDLFQSLYSSSTGYRNWFQTQAPLLTFILPKILKVEGESGGGLCCSTIPCLAASKLATMQSLQPGLGSICFA